jgi:hypothetical protein
LLELIRHPLGRTADVAPPLMSRADAGNPEKLGQVRFEFPTLLVEISFNVLHETLSFPARG